jgi:fermentation-respiration switch protein FrsA (DUF1100 family)
MKNFLRQAAIVALVGCALFGTGRTTAQSPTAGKAPISAIPKVDPGYYDYDASIPVAATSSPFPIQNGVPVLRITYPSPITTPYPVNNIVTAYLFLPPGPGPHPAMVVLHEWNAGSTAAGFALCDAIVRAGVAALMVEEPYSLNRRPEDPHSPNPEILSSNVPQMREALRQAVLDARRGLDYLSQRPDIDPKRLGVSGISLGGVLSGVVAKVDPRVSVVVTLVGGADFARGFWDGLLTRHFRSEIQRSGYSFETFRAALAPMDASNWPRAFDPQGALMINGRYDLVIFPRQAEALSRALGGAPIVWGNAGHYGLKFSQAQASDVLERFLRARFFGEGAPYQPPHEIPARTIKAGILLGGHEGVSPVLAYQILNFDPQGRLSIDGQLTLHGLAAALSLRLGPIGSIGLEFPMLHGEPRPRPFVMASLTL